MKLKSTIKLKKIDLTKAVDCNHPDISTDKRYMVIYNKEIILGKFSKQWYGYNFYWFGSAYAGLQLDLLKEVWEIL